MFWDDHSSLIWTDETLISSRVLCLTNRLGEVGLWELDTVLLSSWHLSANANAFSYQDQPPVLSEPCENDPALLPTPLQMPLQFCPRTQLVRVHVPRRTSLSATAAYGLKVYTSYYMTMCSRSSSSEGTRSHYPISLAAFPSTRVTLSVASSIVYSTSDIILT